MLETQASAPALSARQIRVVVDGRPLVDGVDFSVAPGAWLTVAGPNGAGKTTLLRAVAQLVRHSGDVFVAGERLEGLRPAQRARRLAIVPQHPVIPPGMTVSAYVLLGRTAHLGPLGVEGDADRDACQRVIAELDLSAFANRELASLSGGERQRAVIARALAQAAPVLLLDEPTTGLDIGYQQDVLDLIDEIRTKTNLAICSTMHDLTLAGSYADEIALLTEGRFIAVGPPSSTLTEANLSLITRARVRLVREGNTTVVVPLPRNSRREAP